MEVCIISENPLMKNALEAEVHALGILPSFASFDRLPKPSDAMPLIIADCENDRAFAEKLLFEAKELNLPRFVIVSEFEKSLSSLEDDKRKIFIRPFLFSDLRSSLLYVLNNCRSGENDPSLASQSIPSKRLKLSSTSRLATFDSNPLDLSKKEFDILLLLYQNRGRVLSREEIFKSVWKDDANKSGSNTVDVFVRYIRSKIDDVYSVKLISTVRGRGYAIFEK